MQINTLFQKFIFILLGAILFLAPGCSDKCLNGKIDNGELGIDCGGDCSPCPTCADGIKNGDEEDIDCGGICPACPPLPTCSDGIMNQNETGIDCGGVCQACIAPILIDSVVFDAEKAFFAFDGIMAQPVDSTVAKTMVDKIGIVYYYYTNGYNDPGFMDPLTKSVYSYFNTSHLPWLSTSKEINIYTFDQDSIWARKDLFMHDEKLMEQFILDSNYSRLTNHVFFDPGKNIGGKSTSLNSARDRIKTGNYVGIEFLSSNRFAIMFIRFNQENNGVGIWPSSLDYPYKTKVDIYLQH